MDNSNEKLSEAIGQLAQAVVHLANAVMMSVEDEDDQDDDAAIPATLD